MVSECFVLVPEVYKLLQQYHRSDGYKMPSDKDLYDLGPNDTEEVEEDLHFGEETINYIVQFFLEWFIANDPNSPHEE